MLRKLFTPRKHRNSIRRPSFPRLCLEQLEQREMLDAALVQGFNFLTLNAYQTAQQIGQAQATAQSDLTHFQADAKAYTAGQGVTLGQINQDLATLQQDANNIQGLSATFQNDVQLFIMGLVGNAGNISASDGSSLAVDAYFLQNGQATVNSANQTAANVSSLSLPNPPPPPATPAISSTGTPSSSTSTGNQLTTLTLNPLNVNLLGVNVQTSQIQINISAQSGNGDLLGNVLNDTSNLLNLPAVSGVLNNVLANVVTLLNSGSLSVAGVNTSSGSLSTPSSTSATTTPVLTLHVAPVTLNLLGATVTTSPIDLTITATSGQGLVLGNVVTDLANLFNPPLPKKLSLDYINSKLGDLLNTLNQQLPNVGTTPSPVTLAPGQFLALEVSPINLNLLGLILQTSQIQVNASNQTGNGDLLGNIATTVLNTVDATPQNLTTFNNDVNAILGKVIGVLNAATLAIPSNVVNSLSNVLQQLTSPTLVNNSGTSQTVPILNLAIASPNGSTPPVNVNLLGLQITTSNIQAQLEAQTGDGQILGNLLYNVANLLNPGGTASLLPILGALGL
jgi:hypothetical protein